MTDERKPEEEVVHFEDMPRLLNQLSSDMHKVNEQITLINKELKRIKGKTANGWLSVKMLEDYIPSHPARPTIYGWVSNGEIPYHKGLKTISFDKKEIDEWLSLQHVVPDWWNDREKRLLGENL